MHDASTRLASEVVDDLARFLGTARQTDLPWSGAKLYNTRIRRNIKLAESSSFGQTVFEYAPRSNGAIDYANLAAELSSDAFMAPRHAASGDERSSEGVSVSGPRSRPAASPNGDFDQPPPQANDDGQLETAPVRVWADSAPTVDAPQSDTMISTP
jgi:hypothetical protein